MARTLIVYYSLIGNTAKVAALLAAKLPADLERIEDLGKRTGTIGLLRCAYGGARAMGVRSRRRGVRPFHARRLNSGRWR